jgi:hypothetical protein
MNNHWVIDPSQNCYFLCQSKIEDGHYRTNLTSIRLKSAVIIHYVAPPPQTSDKPNKMLCPDKVMVRQMNGAVNKILIVPFYKGKAF